MRRYSGLAPSGPRAEASVITCPKCSKDNQDHYKFCLGCGAELPRDAAPKPFSPQTPPQGMKAAQPAAVPPPAGGGLGGTVLVSAPAAAVARPAAAPAPVAPAAAAAPQATVASSPAASVAPAAGGPTVPCPQCGHINQPSNLFCGSCGFRMGGASARPAAAAAPAASPAASGGANMVLTALRADGTEAGTFQMPAGGATVGRETGGIFAGDSYLSPRHATFRVPGGGRASVKDEGSLNGVYKKLARDVPVELRPNDVFRIGQEIVKFEPLVPLPASADGVERLGAPSKGYV